MRASHLVFVANMLFTHAVYAGSSGTTDTACGSTQVAWNVPKGGLVTHSGKGPIGAVLQALGESRTHSMLSHGPGEWVSHSTIFNPGNNGWPTYCDTPVRANEMREGFPGASQVSQGGIYQYLFDGGSVHALAYSIASSGERRVAAERAADNAWWATPYATVTSRQDGGQSFYILGEAETRACQYRHWNTPQQNNCPQEWLGSSDGCDCGCQTQDSDCVIDGGFHHVRYQFFNFLDVMGRPYGEYTYENGAQCSSFAAEQYRHASGDYIEPATYTHEQTVAAGDALYNAVYRQCKAGLGDWGNIGASLTCAFPYFDLDICDDAARQVRNCFVHPSHCDSSSGTPWNNLKKDEAVQAHSISPDRLVGAAGHFPPGSEHTGPWAGNSEAPVQWNSAGNVYGCWF